MENKKKGGKSQQVVRELKLIGTTLQATNAPTTALFQNVALVIIAYWSSWAARQHLQFFIINLTNQLKTNIMHS